MFDPQTPLLAEVRAIRARLGADDLGEWRTWQCPLSPCLTSILLAHDEDIKRGKCDALTAFHMLDHLEHLSTAPPDPNRLREAPLLDMWSVRRMDDGCLHLIGEVSEHAKLADRTGIFSAPYLRLDRVGGWARSRHQLYRLRSQDRGSSDLLIMD